MSTAPVTAPAFLTTEEFAERPDPGYTEELTIPELLGDFRVRVGRFFE
jgi:hypothetical protein